MKQEFRIFSNSCSAIPLATMRGRAFAWILVGATYLALVACTSATITTDVRTPGTVVDDGLIQQQAKRVLQEELHHEQNERIRVSVFNGVVLLTGQITSAKRRQQATDIVANIDQVRAVQNELTTEDFRSVLERPRDSYLASRVRAKLLTDESVDFDQFNIVVDRGNVYLMGLATEEETEHVTEIIRNIRGIQAVIKVVEYMEAENE